MKASALPVVLGTLALAGCSEVRTESAVEHGRAIFEGRERSLAETSRFSCSTCHAVDADANRSARRYPGALLAGATERPSYWGGQENDLLRAVEACLRSFMQRSEPLDTDAPEAESLYAYLSSLEPTLTEPVAFTVIRAVVDVPRGDAERGAAIYDATCRPCHGRSHSGDGRLTADAPILPEAPVAAHAEYTSEEVRLVFIEKTRHGGFLGYGGSMPPFSLETLSDAELGALLEFLEQ